MNRRYRKMNMMITAAAVFLMLFLLVSCGQDGGNGPDADDRAVINEVVADFEKLAAVPRKTGHEQAVSDMLKKWAEDLGLEVRQNEVNDLIIEVPATDGYENLPLACLQGHIDMVCVARDGVDYDPLTDPVKTVISEEDMTMTADGTSLGADDGIGVAMIMAITEGKMDHGPLRVILTTDEEEGFSGVSAIRPEDLEGIRYLLNIDSEVSDTLTISSAAGSNIIASAEPEMTAPAGDETVLIGISGLSGGHSGVTIHEGRCNGITELCRLLKDMKEQIPLGIVSVKGGQADNVIPDKAEAVISVRGADRDALAAFVQKREKELNDKYKDVEKDIKITVSDGEKETQVLDDAQADRILTYVTGSIDGVWSMSEEVEDLVESSCNMGKIDVGSDGIEIRQLSRSSSDEKIEEIHEHQKKVGEEMGFGVEVIPGTKAWPADPDSVLAKQIPEIYRQQNGKDMKVTGVHAGLECAEFFSIDPSIDMVSIGPDIVDGHSPNELVHLDSIPVTWNILKELLIALK